MNSSHLFDVGGDATTCQQSVSEITPSEIHLYPFYPTFLEQQDNAYTYSASCILKTYELYHANANIIENIR